MVKFVENIDLMFQISLISQCTRRTVHRRRRRSWQMQILTPSEPTFLWKFLWNYDHCCGWSPDTVL